MGLFQLVITSFLTPTGTVKLLRVHISILDILILKVCWYLTIVSLRTFDLVKGILSQTIMILKIHQSLTSLDYIVFTCYHYPTWFENIIFILFIILKISKKYVSYPKFTTRIKFYYLNNLNDTVCLQSPKFHIVSFKLLFFNF